MSTVSKIERITVEEYLAGEEVSSVKHEYLEGLLFQAVSKPNAHALITSNLYGILYNEVKHSPCQLFNSDTKLRINTNTGVRFYYPDAQVICEKNPQSDLFQETPAIIFEVMSQSTRRTDEFEKREWYLTLPSLVGYVLIEQHVPQATVYRRQESEFQKEVYHDIADVILFDQPKLQIPMKDLYWEIEIAGQR